MAVRLKIPACAGMTRHPASPEIARQLQGRRTAWIFLCWRGRAIVAAVGMALLTIFFAGNVSALELRGHAKLQATSTGFPSDSLLRDFSDDPARDTGIDLRANFSDRVDGWTWHADYQLLARQGDQLELQQQTSLVDAGYATLPDDERRVFDLTHRISTRDDRVITHRLDRFYLSHTSDKTVFNIGRQAVSWGNGLIYNPVDFFNPFDPAAIDTEYKTGDDMLYAQYLLDSGDDLQAVWVERRDADGDVEAEVSSIALKYHGFTSQAEYDLLAAEHYDSAVVALGVALDLADAIWRSDILVTDSGADHFTSAVLNWSYSWIAWDKNLSATVEYFHNGFGIDDGDYGPQALARNPELLQRLQRGELFTLGENYLAAALTVELAPLWVLTSTLFNNLDDDSRLLQIFSRHDLQQDLQLLLALNLPQGDDGSEFGGIESGIAGRPLALDASIFAQLAWYF
ncbi:MAG: hypothetical protein OEN02_16375 [Gammaproteobacteria bacterium]|nr:hypothetical protein [Gammaproteobacteria bacterium]MDH3536697.1 hypothetical protein [Gammaproteobacteria bacterium]